MKHVLQNDRVLWPDGSLAEGSVVIEDSAVAPGAAAGVTAAPGEHTIPVGGFVLLWAPVRAYCIRAPRM